VEWPKIVEICFSELESKGSRQAKKNRKNELATKREQDAIAAMPRQLRASLQNARFLGDSSNPIDAFVTITH